jgi:hypothetical protein
VDFNTIDNHIWLGNSQRRAEVYYDLAIPDHYQPTDPGSQTNGIAIDLNNTIACPQ